MYAFCMRRLWVACIGVAIIGASLAGNAGAAPIAEMAEGAWYRTAIIEAAQHWLPHSARNLYVSNCFHGTRRIMVCRLYETGYDWIWDKPDPNGFGELDSIDAERVPHHRAVHVFSCADDLFRHNRCRRGPLWLINRTVPLAPAPWSR